MAIALPLGVIEPSALGAITKPIVLLAGDQDSYCPVNDLAALAERLGPLARLRSFLVPIIFSAAVITR